MSEPDGTQSSLDETIRDVLRFMDEVVLPSMRDYETFGDVLFRVRQDASCNACVFEFRPDRFLVEFNTGVASELHALLQTSASASASLSAKHLDDCRKLSLDTNTALSLSFVSALVFVLLHEVFHALGGHVRFTNSLTGKEPSSQPHGLDERAMARDASTRTDDARFATLLELEADGAAYETTIGFTEEIFATVMDSTPFPFDRSAPIERAVILGCLAGISRLDALGETERTTASAYPLHGVRIMNVCSAHFRSATRTLSSGTDATGHRVSLDDASVDELVERYEATILPAIYLVDELLSTRYDAPCFLERGAGERDPSSALLKDVALVLGGDSPSHSMAGQELCRLVALSVAYTERLAPYRRANLW